MLKDQLIELITIFNGAPPDAFTTRRVEEILIENDLEDPAKVPIWLSEMLTCVLSKKTCNRTFFTYQPGYGDVANLLAELESLVNAEWDDYGEAVKITVSRIGLAILISTEGNFYEVTFEK